jgi:dolichol-phosphate mannosyltransferase
MDISIILPTYNERDNIIVLVNKIIRILRRYTKKEIIIVDDSSPDGTYLYTKEIYKNEKIVNILLRKKDFSLGKSIGYGIKKSKGKLIIVMDTDLTHNPNMIIKLMKYSKKYDLVSASRYVKGGSMYSLFHYIFSLIFNFFLTILLQSEIKDNLGGFYCVHKKAINKLKFKKIFYGYGEYYFRLLFYLRKNKVRMLEIPSRYNKRNSGESKSNFIVLLFKYSFQAIVLRLKNLT